MIGQTGKLYVPVEQAKSKSLPHSNGNDTMQLDDTKYKVYIHNLDEELADIASEEEQLVFLPDIDKKLNKIPKSVLTGHVDHVKNRQMVLYSVPTSLSVPREQDNVRKAIIESRARARDKQAEEANSTHMGNGLTPEVAHGSWGYGDMNQIGDAQFAADDQDAMDIG